MKAIIDEITQILPIPQNPSEPGDSAFWTNIEEQCKTALPDDYKWFINTYGSGQIGGFVCIYNPFSANQYINLLSQMKVILDIEKELKRECDDSECPFALFPEADGLLPFAGTDNGDIFFWKTSGNPNHWTVVLADLRSRIFEEYRDVFSVMLKKLAREELNSKIIPEGFMDKENMFTSFK
jgi:hypothetical protein